MMGPQNVLHKYEPLLLNTPICMLLYLLACVIVTASSAVIYMYGYQKFMAFIQQEKEKQTIQLAEVICLSSCNISCYLTTPEPALCYA